jgi:hypothetical protein
LYSPCYETPKNAIKKKSSKTTEGEKKQNRGKNSHIFCDEPRWVFGIFLIAFFNSPCYETPKNAIKKNSSKTTEGGGKKTEEKTPTFFVMSPDGFLGFVFCVFELPLLRNAQKLD